MRQKFLNTLQTSFFAPVFCFSPPFCHMDAQKGLAANGGKDQKLPMSGRVGKGWVGMKVDGGIFYFNLFIFIIIIIFFFLARIIPPARQDKKFIDYKILKMVQYIFILDL